MIKSTEEYERDMAKILTYLRDGNDLDNLAKAIGEDNYGDAMQECIDQGFVKGCHASTMADGSIYVQINRGRPSYFGLKFLQSRE